MNFHIEAGQASDCDEMVALLPRLASFDIPSSRNSKHLWQEDAKTVQSWAQDGNEDCLVHVAKDASGKIIGIAITTLRPELLSHSPSAHLEAIAVAKNAEGNGVGAALLAATEGAARERGARSMSLHVFASNDRARKVYERHGYDEELIRCIKPFSEDALK